MATTYPLGAGQSQIGRALDGIDKGEDGQHAKGDPGMQWFFEVVRRRGSVCRIASTATGSSRSVVQNFSRNEFAKTRAIAGAAQRTMPAASSLRNRWSGDGVGSADRRSGASGSSSSCAEGRFGRSRGAADQLRALFGDHYGRCVGMG